MLAAKIKRNCHLGIFAGRLGIKGVLHHAALTDNLFWLTKPDRSGYKNILKILDSSIQTDLKHCFSR